MNACSKNGVTCLHLASVSGKIDLVEYLIDVQNMDPKIRSTASESQPIHVATNAGHIHIVEYLMRVHGCDPTDEDKNEENCLTLAIKNKKREMAIWLVKTDRFPLDEETRRGFNYFAYALVKGQ